MKKLMDIIGELDRCVKCGSCRSNCPTFGVTRREGASARGRLAVIEAHAQGLVGFTQAYKRHLKDCTLCGTCYATCPNSVNTPKIVLAGRAESVEKEGLPLATTLFLKHVLDSKTLGPMAMKFASKLQGLVTKEGAEVTQRGLISRFLTPYLGDERPPPPLARTFFMDSVEVKTLSRKPRTRGSAPARVDGLKIGFFAGCGVNYMLPDIGRATLRLLADAGARVSVPPLQSCCGMPALSMGDVETAKNLALRNIEAFEGFDFDYITTSCATCTYSLKTNFAELFEQDGPEIKARVALLSAKVRDITDLLINEFDIADSESSEQVVTYHDPCHLARGLGIKDAPRDLLAKSGLQFKELKNPCKCCGLGGGLGLSNFKLSMDIMEEKAKNIVATGADVVATACPGCMIQIKDGLKKMGSDTKVSHVVELL